MHMYKVFTKKRLSLCLALVMLLTALTGLSGCGPSTEDDGDISNKTVVVFCPSSIVKADDALLKEYKRVMKEDLGFNVDFITPPIASVEEKLGIMLSSDQQIDVIWTWGVPLILNMANKEYILP